jgi:hypothetical protein
LSHARELASGVAALGLAVACNSVLGIGDHYTVRDDASGGMPASGGAGAKGGTSGRGTAGTSMSGNGGTGANATGGSTTGGADGTNHGGHGGTGGTSATGGDANGGSGAGTGGDGASGQAGDNGSGGSGGSGGSSRGGQGGSAGAGSGRGGQGGSAAGHGGTGGGTAGISGSSTGGAGSGGLLFMEDFETDTPGAAPSGWDLYVGDEVQAGDSTHFAVVDATNHYRTSRSLHVKADQTGAQIVRQFNSPSPKPLYVEFWVWSSRALGRETDTAFKLATVLELWDTETPSRIDFGEVNGNLGLHLNGTEAVWPTTANDPNGAYISGHTWQCFHLSFLINATTGDHFAMDGSTGMYAASPANFTNQPANDWIRSVIGGFTFNLKLGWKGYDTSAEAANELWIDDIIVSDTDFPVCGESS